MKKNKLIKTITGIVTIMSIFCILPIQAHAEWKQNDIGWWNTEGSSWSIGWKLINNTWYHFDNNGYMEKGWISDNNNWYFLDSNGVMQVGTIQVDGKVYYLNTNGAMQTGDVDIDKQSYHFTLSGEADGAKIPQFDKEFLSNGQPIITSPQLKKETKTTEISLKGNPTTGCSWQYSFDVDGIIKEDSSNYIPDKTNQEICGSGGIYNWTFSGLKEGSTKVTFKYSQPWEKEKIYEIKNYIIVVDKDLNITVQQQ